MNASCTIGINVGNTNTVVALINTADCSCVNRSFFKSAHGVDGVAEAVAKILPASNGIVGIASVITGRAQELSLALQFATPTATVHIVDGLASLPFRIGYATPATLGADRIADALYAYAAYRSRDAIIVDAGTAVTVDLLTGAGVFAGGFIMPGLGLQLGALHGGTSALPYVSAVQSKVTVPVNTTQAIGEGVLTMHAGGINLAVSRLLNLCPEAVILATGGGFLQAKEWYMFPYEYVGEMTVVGAGMI